MLVCRAGGSASSGARGPRRSRSCRPPIEDSPLEPDDLERLATAAFLAGQDDVSVEAWERAHQELLRSGDVLRAARCSGWLIFVLLTTGEFARAGGWLARTRRLLEDVRVDCAEKGHLLIPEAFQHAVDGRLGDRLRDRRPAPPRSAIGSPTSIW